MSYQFQCCDSVSSFSGLADKDVVPRDDGISVQELGRKLGMRPHPTELFEEIPSEAASVVAGSARDQRQVCGEEFLELLFPLLRDGENLLKRILDRSWLLVYLFQHEMGISSFRCSVFVKPVFLDW